MRFEVGPLLFLAGCVVWSQNSPATGVTPVSHRPLAGTWVTEDGDSAVIRARSTLGGYTVRLYSAGGDITPGSSSLALTGTLIGLGSVLLMDLKWSGSPDHFQALIKMAGDTLTVSLLDLKAVRAAFASGKAVTPNLTIDDRESGETRTQLTGSPAELRRFLIEASTPPKDTTDHRDWLVDLKPALRVTKE